MTRKTNPKNSKRRIPKWLILVFIALVIAVIVFAYYQFAPLEGPVPDDAGAQYVELEKGYTVQGFPRLGSETAPVLVEEFTSYACPHCMDFHQDQFPDLLDEIAAGQVQFVLFPVSNIGPGAKDAAKGLFCAGEQDQLWAMHDVLFHWKEKFITRTFDKKRHMEAAKTLGLDVNTFETCFDSSQIDPLLDTVRTEIRARGVTGTPTVFINGEKVKDYRELDKLSELAETLQAN